MNIFNRFSLALLSTHLLFAAGTAVPYHRHKLAKRLPTDWKLYNDWNYQLETIPYICEEAAEGDVGTFDRSTRTLTWATDSCGEMVATWDKVPIAKGEVSVYKGTLQTKKDGEVESTQDVVVKRGLSESTSAIIYGASLQIELGNNDNILGALGAVVSNDGDAGNAIMPYISGSSLEQNFGSFSDQSSVNSAFKQILNAVSAVQKAGIIHRDLKPENFLLDGSTLKLIDFDTATKATSSSAFTVGTRTYAAPEIVSWGTKFEDKPNGGPYTNKVDTFSIGMTFLVMSVADLQNEDNRFDLWRNLIQPNGQLWPSADTVASILKGKNYGVFNGNDNLLNVISKALCEPDTRYDPQSFQSAFEGVV